MLYDHTDWHARLRTIKPANVLARNPTNYPELKATIEYALERTEWPLESNEAAQSLLKVAQRIPAINRLNYSDPQKATRAMRNAWEKVREASSTYHVEQRGPFRQIIAAPGGGVQSYTRILTTCREELISAFPEADPPGPSGWIGASIRELLPVSPKPTHFGNSDSEEANSTIPLHSGSRQARTLQEDDWQQLPFSLRAGRPTVSVSRHNPTGGAVAGPSTSGALTSTPGAAASSFAGPFTVHTASPSTSTAATLAKRKPSNDSTVRKRKKKDHPNKVAISESSPMFSNNSLGTQLFPTPLPTSTPASQLEWGSPPHLLSQPGGVNNLMALGLEVPYRRGIIPPTLWDDQSQQQSSSSRAKRLEVHVPSWPASLVYGSDVEQQWVGPSSKCSAVFVSATTASVAPTADVETLITWISPMPVKVNGHFCDVFEGTHSTVGKVALKRPRIGTAGFNEDIIRRFQREAATWGKLQHRHILGYLGSFQRDGHFYFVSPFIENGTLVEYIELHPDASRIKLLCETADAISYLHGEEVVHGDIKANNLLIDDNGQVLLCDFGLTRTTDIRTSTAMKGAGTLRWQSPELWDGGSKSFKSDVYAFGITIAEVLTGDVPFPELQTDGAVIRAVLIEGRRPSKNPAESSTGLSYEKVWSVAEACWHATPEERISMSEALQLIQADQAPTAIHPSLVGDIDKVQTVYNSFKRAVNEGEQAVEAPPEEPEAGPDEKQPRKIKAKPRSKSKPRRMSESPSPPSTNESANAGVGEMDIDYLVHDPHEPFNRAGRSLNNYFLSQQQSPQSLMKLTESLPVSTYNHGTPSVFGSSGVVPHAWLPSSTMDSFGNMTQFNNDIFANVPPSLPSLSQPQYPIVSHRFTGRGGFGNLSPPSSSTGVPTFDFSSTNLPFGGFSTTGTGSANGGTVDGLDAGSAAAWTDFVGTGVFNNVPDQPFNLTEYDHEAIIGMSNDGDD